MKKWLKIILIIIGIFIVGIGLDIVSIYTLNKPIFAIKDDCDCADQVYKGLLYDTYNCLEYPNPQIKAKWTKYSCNDNKGFVIGKIIELKDNYIVIKGVNDNNNLAYDEEAHISLTNNPKIEGTNNLIVGQYIKLIPFTIQEIYPSIMYTNKIEIIDENDF